VRRGERALVLRLESGRERARRRRDRLEALRWDRQLAARREGLARKADRLHALFRGVVDRRRAGLARITGRLEGLSPLAVLSRGYALVWDEATGALLRQASKTEVGRHLSIRLHRGAVRATVESREPE
jgi:exodeoxyribonuclease VII large subunit